MKTNIQYKNSVFTTLFGNEEKIIELYGAIEGKVFPDDVDVQINTLTGALFLDRLNDVSFTIDNKLVVLVEHQASLNENMPLRCLLYITRLYEQILKSKNIYKKSLLKIPTPEFIVLYNGADEYPDKQKLKLSDAFKIQGKEIDLELTVKVFNINKGHNIEITKRSKTLDDYIFFIDRIRGNLKSGMTLENAITESIKFCIANGIMRDFLETNGSEVTNMLFVEFNMDDALEVAREEGFEKGIEKGLEKGFEEGIEKAARNLKESGALSNEQISQVLGLAVEAIEGL